MATGRIRKFAIINSTWSKLYTFGYHAASFTVTTALAGMATLTVTKAGAGTGTISNAPNGIDCGAVCAATC